MVCLNHPDREAVYKCAACGKPLCEECIIENEGDVYCSDSCMTKGIASKARSAYIISDTARNNRKRGVKGFVTFVIILIIAAVAYYFYTQNKEKIDSHVSEKFNTVSSEAKSAKDAFIEAGHKKAPTDSKYRRQREGIVNEGKTQKR